MSTCSAVRGLGILGLASDLPLVPPSSGRSTGLLWNSADAFMFMAPPPPQPRGPGSGELVPQGPAAPAAAASRCPRRPPQPAALLYVRCRTVSSPPRQMHDLLCQVHVVCGLSTSCQLRQERCCQPRRCKALLISHRACPLQAGAVLIRCNCSEYDLVRPCISQMQPCWRSSLQQQGDGFCARFAKGDLQLWQCQC